MMKTIKKGLWPGAARAEAERHNRECHDGDAVAHITIDRESTSWAPKYMVLCPICWIKKGE